MGRAGKLREEGRQAGMGQGQSWNPSGSFPVHARQCSADVWALWSWLTCCHHQPQRLMGLSRFCVMGVWVQEGEWWQEKATGWFEAGEGGHYSIDHLTPLSLQLKTGDGLTLSNVVPFVYRVEMGTNRFPGGSLEKKMEYPKPSIPLRFKIKNLNSDYSMTTQIGHSNIAETAMTITSKKRISFPIPLLSRWQIIYRFGLSKCFVIDAPPALHSFLSTGQTKENIGNVCQFCLPPLQEPHWYSFNTFDSEQVQITKPEHSAPAAIRHTSLVLLSRPFLVSSLHPRKAASRFPFPKGDSDVATERIIITRVRLGMFIYPTVYVPFSLVLTPHVADSPRPLWHLHCWGL